MAKVSSGVTLNSDFFLNNFYQANRSAAKKTTRDKFSQNELSYEDARALKRAAKKLGSCKFDETVNEGNLYSTVKAFADTYNNALSSATKATDYEVGKLSKHLKNLTEKYSTQLKSIGVTVKEDGSLSVNEDTLKTKEVKEIQKVFSKEENDLLETTSKLSRRLQTTSSNALYLEMTGNGGRINITL